MVHLAGEFNNHVDSFGKTIYSSSASHSRNPGIKWLHKGINLFWTVIDSRDLYMGSGETFVTTLRGDGRLG